MIVPRYVNMTNEEQTEHLLKMHGVPLQRQRWFDHKKGHFEAPPVRHTHETPRKPYRGSLKDIDKHRSVSVRTIPVAPPGSGRRK